LWALGFGLWAGKARRAPVYNLSMAGEYVPIEKLEVTVRFENLSDWIWNQVMEWPRLAQDTIGKQILNAGDSVAANIVEGGNQEGDPDSLRFFGYARGSA